MRLSHTFFQLLLVVLFGASLPAQARVEIDFGQQVQRPSGLAQVVSITAAETPEVEAGGMVTGTFQTWYRDLRELWVEGLKTPVRVTGGHRFYSASRQTWIAAQHLQIGETIRTRDGAGRRVLAVETLVGEHPVYNLEVETAHQYHVTAAGLLTHNNEGCPLTSSQQMTAEVSEDLAANNGVDLTLKYKAGWTDAQRGAADGKAAALTQADTVVTPSPVRSGTTQGLGQGVDADHTVDLQLGGADDILTNMSALDSSVNRSLGSQINKQIKTLPAGTRVNNVRMVDP